MENINGNLKRGKKPKKIVILDLMKK